MHEEASIELSGNKKLSDRAYRDWNTSAYEYNLAKRRFEFREELGRSYAVKKYLKDKYWEDIVIMNKNQAVAYAQMALSTIQNSANGENKIKDLNLYDFGEEVKIMFELHPLKEIEKRITKILLKI